MVLEGLEGGDYEDVQISVYMKGDNFEFTAQLTYYDQVRRR